MSWSADAINAMLGAQTSEVLLTLLEITYAPGEVLRLCDNTEAITHSGNTFIPFAFSIRWPDELEEQIPTAILEIDHVDQTVYTAIATATSASFKKTVRAMQVLASSPNTLERDRLFNLGPIEGDDETITATLTLDLALNEVFPGYSFTPQYFPKLFTKP